MTELTMGDFLSNDALMDNCKNVSEFMPINDESPWYGMTKKAWQDFLGNKKFEELQSEGRFTELTFDNAELTKEGQINE